MRLKASSQLLEVNGTRKIKAFTAKKTSPLSTENLQKLFVTLIILSSDKVSENKLWC